MSSPRFSQSKKPHALRFANAPSPSVLVCKTSHTRPASTPRPHLHPAPLNSPSLRTNRLRDASLLSTLASSKRVLSTKTILQEPCFATSSPTLFPSCAFTLQSCVEGPVSRRSEERGREARLSSTQPRLQSAAQEPLERLGVDVRLRGAVSGREYYAAAQVPCAQRSGSLRAHSLKGR